MSKTLPYWRVDANLISVDFPQGRYDLGAINGAGVAAKQTIEVPAGGVAIDVSQEASLLMDSAPTTQTSATPTGSSVVSMFQTNSIAVRVERLINWSRRRTYGVGYIDNVHTS